MEKILEFLIKLIFKTNVKIDVVKNEGGEE